MPTPPHAKRSRLGFDDAEAVDRQDYESDDDDERHEAEEVPSELEINPTCPDPRCRKRLWQKTASAETGDPARALLKASEYRILKHKYKMELKKQRAKFRKARIEAIELLARGAPTGAFAADEWITTGPIEQPHSSHRIVAQ